MKFESTTATILCNSMERRHPYPLNIRIKESDRRPFILILDSILVYVTLIKWMDLSPYPNLLKAEKIKSALKGITGRFLLSLIWLISYVTNSRKSVYSQVSNGYGVWNIREGVEKISKTNSRRLGIVERAGKKWKL